MATGVCEADDLEVGDIKGGSSGGIPGSGLGFELGARAISGNGFSKGMSNGSGAMVVRVLAKKIHKVLKSDGLVSAGG